MELEAVVLTGGASRRMGQDKARVTVDGIPMAERIVGQLVKAGIAVTVLGRKPVLGAAFIPDSETYAGPLVALAAFHPSAEFVFVASCDLPLFDARVVQLMQQLIGGSDAAIPLIKDRLQPLCALYRAPALMKAKEVISEGRRSVMALVERLSIFEIVEEHFLIADLNSASVLGVNTPKELADALTVEGQ